MENLELTLGRSLVIFWMEAPFLPMMYLCSQEGQCTSFFTTELAFSYTLVRAVA